MSIHMLEKASGTDKEKNTLDGKNPHTESAIAVHALRKTFPGGVEAVKGVSFDVARGEVFGLVGPNGAGKSTTIGMLTSTVIPDGGSAWLAGVDVAVDPIKARKLSSVVFQEPTVDRGLSGRANLKLHARLWSVPTTEVHRRIEELVKSFDLGGIVDRPVATYSGGQRRRLEIARALVSHPQVLFLDEPTVGLDPRIRYELLDLIASLRDGGEVTILLTTHYLEEAERLCDRVAIMHEGRIVALDTPFNLLAGLGREVVEIRIDGDAHRAHATLRRAGLAGDDAYVVGSTLTLPMHDTRSSDTLAGIGNLNLPVLALAARRPTLDDVYLHLTGDRVFDAA